MKIPKKGKYASTLGKGERYYKRINFLHTKVKILPIAQKPSESTIDNMVYNGNVDQQKEIILNEHLLTEAHCRYLFPIFKDSTYMYSLVKAPTFPVDLLLELAMDSKYDGLLPWTASHPNITEDYCRYLFPRVKDSPNICSLVRVPAFPVDLLLELALDSNNSNALWPWIALHPNITEEIQTIMALRDM
jgi:hypothetical protein